MDVAAALPSALQGEDPQKTRKMVASRKAHLFAVALDQPIAEEPLPLERHRPEPGYPFVPDDKRGKPINPGISGKNTRQLTFGKIQIEDRIWPVNIPSLGDAPGAPLGFSGLTAPPLGLFL